MGFGGNRETRSSSSNNNSLDLRRSKKTLFFPSSEQEARDGDAATFITFLAPEIEKE